MNYLYRACALFIMVSSSWVTGCNDNAKPLELKDLTKHNKNGLILLVLERDKILQGALQSLKAQSEAQSESTQAERQLEKVKNILNKISSATKSEPELKEEAAQGSDFTWYSQQMQRINTMSASEMQNTLRMIVRTIVQVPTAQKSVKFNDAVQKYSDPGKERYHSDSDSENDEEVAAPSIHAGNRVSKQPITELTPERFHQLCARFKSATASPRYQAQGAPNGMVRGTNLAGETIMVSEYDASDDEPESIAQYMAAPAHLVLKEEKENGKAA